MKKEHIKYITAALQAAIKASKHVGNVSQTQKLQQTLDAFTIYVSE